VIDGLPLLAEPVDAEEGGLTVPAWVRLWSMCHVVMGDGILRTAWPDGGAAVEQPYIVVNMFELITGQVAESVKANG
jgi:hypothetical protein